MGGWPVRHMSMYKTSVPLGLICDMTGDTEVLLHALGSLVSPG
jgi:hypothetical protein